MDDPALPLSLNSHGIASELVLAHGDAQAERHADDWVYVLSDSGDLAGAALWREISDIIARVRKN